MSKRGVLNLCNSDVFLVARTLEAHARQIELLGEKVEAKRLREIADEYRRLAEESTDEGAT